MRATLPVFILVAGECSPPPRRPLRERFSLHDGVLPRANAADGGLIEFDLDGLSRLDAGLPDIGASELH